MSTENIESLKQRMSATEHYFNNRIDNSDPNTVIMLNQMAIMKGLSVLLGHERDPFPDLTIESIFDASEKLKEHRDKLDL